MPLAAFRKNRFNILFYEAGRVYFLREHMFDYWRTSRGSLNLLLQAVLADLKVPQYLAGCRALGMIDKLVTGPLWRHLQLSSTSVLSMSEVYTAMMEKFDEWGKDALAVVEGCAHLLPQHDCPNMMFDKAVFIQSESRQHWFNCLQLLSLSFASLSFGSTLSLFSLLPLVA